MAGGAGDGTERAHHAARRRWQMVNYAICAVALLSAAACGGVGASSQAGPPSSLPGTTPSSTPATSVEPTSAITVGLATTCDLLFNGAPPSIVTRAADFVKKINYADKDSKSADTLVEDLGTAAASAQRGVKPYIDAMITPIRIVREQIRRGVGGTVSLTDFRAGALELLNRCTPYIR